MCMSMVILWELIRICSQLTTHVSYYRKSINYVYMEKKKSEFNHLSLGIH